MYVIKPNAINDAALVSSSVPEADYPAWNAATSYAVGDRVIRTTTHKVYEAILAGVNAGLPENTSARWVPVGPTNRWAMLDSEVGSQTTAANSLSVTLAPGYATALALLELDANSVSVSVKSPDTVVATPTPHNMLARSEEFDVSGVWASSVSTVVANAAQRPDAATSAHNLLLRSQELTSTPWLIGPNITPNGQVGELLGVPAWQFTSNSTGNSFVTQLLTALTPGAVYTASFLCDVAAGGYAMVRVVSGATNVQIPYTVTSAGPGVFRYSCTFRYPEAGGTGVYVFAGRIDADAGTVFRATAAQLNLGPDVLPYAVTTVAAIMPSNPTADLVSVSGQFGGPGQYAAGLLAARTYTASCYFKRADAGAFAYVTFFDGTNAAECWFNLATGTVAGAYVAGSISNPVGGLEVLSGGWFRCWFTVTIGTAGGYAVYYRPAAANGAASNTGDRCYVWGAQVAQAEAPLAYVPTTNAAIGTPGATTPTLVPGVVTYSETRSLDTSVLLSWADYFYSDPVSRSEISFSGLYIGGGYTVTVTLTGATVKCGALVVGEATDLGAVEYGATLGIIDYSRKTTDDFGVVSITRRKYAKRLTARMAFERERMARVYRALAAVRSTPCVYVTTEANGYESLTVYGFFKDFRVEVAYPTHNYCSLEVEGLI